MNTKKRAQKDAFELARAQMFFGEGAGTRRKLIENTVRQRITDDPNGYGVAFTNAVNNEDMADHAAAARKERKKIDRHESVQKNTRALLTGNHQNLRSNVLLLIVVGTALHKSGADQVIYAKGKEVAGNTVHFYKTVAVKVKRKLREERAKAGGTNVTDLPKER